MYIDTLERTHNVLRQVIGEATRRSKRQAAKAANVAGAWPRNPTPRQAMNSKKAAYGRGMRMGEAQRWRGQHKEPLDKVAARGKSVAQYVKSHKTMTTAGAGAALLGVNAMGSNRRGSGASASTYGYRRGRGSRGIYKY